MQGRKGTGQTRQGIEGGCCCWRWWRCSSTTNLFSTTISSVQHAESAHTNDVILLYLDMCLIMLVRCHAWNQKDAQFGYLIPKVVIPSDPVTTSFLFKIYVYIWLNVNELGIFKGVTSHSHAITNINCQCSLNVYLAHSSTDFVHLTCKIALQK